MSELQKVWAKKKLPAAKLAAADFFDERDEEQEEGEKIDHVPELPETYDDDSSSASSASSTGTIVPSPSRNLFARPQG